MANLVHSLFIVPITASHPAKYICHYSGLFDRAALLAAVDQW